MLPNPTRPLNVLASAAAVADAEMAAATAGRPVSHRLIFPHHGTFATVSRFTWLTYADQHRRHRWQPLGNYTAECSGCSAVHRWDWRYPRLGQLDQKGPRHYRRGPFGVCGIQSRAVRNAQDGRQYNHSGPVGFVAPGGSFASLLNRKSGARCHLRTQRPGAPRGRRTTRRRPARASRAPRAARFQCLRPRPYVPTYARPGV